MVVLGSGLRLSDMALSARRLRLLPPRDAAQLRPAARLAGAPRAAPRRGAPRRGRTRRRDRLGHRRAASRRPAGRADRSLGAPIRDPGSRLAPRALPCADPDRDPARIVRWFVRRRRAEVAFQETRAHPGVDETQRRWSDKPWWRARRPACRRCFRSSPRWLLGSPRANGRGSPRPLGTSSRSQPPATRSPRPLPRDLARAGFREITPPRSRPETPPDPAGTLDPRPQPRRLSGQGRGKPLEDMVGATGIEPVTPTMST